MTAASLKDMLQEERRTDLIEAVLAEYPAGHRLHVNVESDENNPGYHMPTTWTLFNAKDEQIGSWEDFGDDDLPFEQEINDYVDDLRITSNFTLDLK